MERESREQLLRIEGMTCAWLRSGGRAGSLPGSRGQDGLGQPVDRRGEGEAYRPRLPRGTCCRGGSGWVQSSTDCQPA